MTPVISVVLPVHNGGRTLRRALGSTLRSRGVDFEVVVLDHGSTDDSASIAHGLSDARVVVVDAAKLGPLPEVLNRGIALARAPLIARMDADDVMHPDRLAHDCAALADASLDGVACSVKLLPEHPRARVTDGLRAYVAWQNACASPEEHAREVWIEQPLCQPATTLRRTTLERFGGYRAGVLPELYPEDYELFLRLLPGGARIHKRAAVHHGWREHSRTATRTSRDTLTRLKVRALAAVFSLGARDVVIAGAGKEGGRIARALLALGVRVTAFVDVDPKKVGRVRHGAPVLPVAELVRLHAAGAFLIVAVGTSGARAVLRAQIAAFGFQEGQDAVVTA